MRTIKECKQVELPLHGDARGKMIVVEGSSQTPFEIKRVFYMFDLDKTAIRGLHANSKSDFVMTCPVGSCKVRLYDGRDESVVTLDSADRALYVPSMIWKEMYDFSDDCVMIVFADTEYMPDEYIRDKTEYAAINSSDL